MDSRRKQSDDTRSRFTMNSKQIPTKKKKVVKLISNYPPDKPKDFRVPMNIN